MDKVSNDEIRAQIDKDGLSYAVLEYCAPEDLEDPRLIGLWQVAKIALTAIKILLGMK